MGRVRLKDGVGGRTGCEVAAGGGGLTAAGPHERQLEPHEVLNGLQQPRRFLHTQQPSRVIAWHMHRTPGGLSLRRKSGSLKHIMPWQISSEYLSWRVCQLENHAFSVLINRRQEASCTSVDPLS